MSEDTKKWAGEEFSRVTRWANWLNNAVRITPTLIRILNSEAIGARVIAMAGQIVNPSTWTPRNFDTVIADTDGCWDGVNVTRLTAQRDGYYSAGGSVELPAAQVVTASRLAMTIRVNGTVYISGSENHTIAGKAAQLGIATGMFWMTAGDYVELCLYHDQAAPRTFSAGSLTYQHQANLWLQRAA